MEIQYHDDKTPFVVWDEKIIQLECEPLKEKYYLEKAKSELRETPENIERGLRELRELLKDEKDLLVPIENDDFLMKFLRPSKFYSASAFQKVKAYYQFRKTHQNYCDNLIPTSVRLPFEHSCISVLSPRDQHGRRILLIESGERWNPQVVSLTEMFRGIQLGLESALVEPRTQVCGVIVILDMKGLTLSHVLQFTPFFAKMIVDWIQDCTPIRLKAVHVVNQPFIFNMLFALFKPFLRQKLRSRIFFHGKDRGSLLTHVDADALRSRHGGNLSDPEISGDVLWKMLHHYEDKFKIANSYGYEKKTGNI